MIHRPVRRGVVLLLAIVGTLLAQGTLSAQGTRGKGKSPSVTTKQGSSKNVDDAVVLEVGREKYTVQQIADAYKKNANRGGKSFYELPLDSAQQFLNLYANYRLKVQEALEQGLDKKPEVAEELRSNRIQLAIPPAPASGYLIERKVVDPAIEKIFKRREDEVKMQVIFSSMRANDPADTLRAYRRSIAMLELLKRGTDFRTLAVDSSNDQTSRANGGVAGYITAGTLFHSLEDAAYSTTPGQLYPQVIRVPSGYVILKVLDRSPRYKVHAAHILFAATGDSTDSSAYRHAVAALQRIRNGEDFGKVARELSDDKTSGENGGEFLTYYTRSLGFESRPGKLVPEFEETLFKLKDGEVSDIVKTQFGYHIIKRIDSRRPTFEEEKDQLRQMYKQYFLADDRLAYVKGVLAKQGFQTDESTLDKVFTAVDRSATTADSSWASRITPDLRKQTLFRFHGVGYTVGDWIDSVEARRDFRAMPLTTESIRNSFVTLMETTALADEAKNLEQDYPEFAGLMREFRDGILIFKLESQMVYDRLKYDEDRGKAYFEKHRSKYMTEPKVGISEIFLYKEDEMKDINQKVHAGTVPFDSLAAQSTQRQGYRDRSGRWEPATPKNADIVKQVLAKKPDAKPGDILDPFPYQGGWSIVRINSVEPSREMTYDEAKSEVTGDYIDDLQKQLTKEWIDTLRLKYAVKINDRVLDQAVASK